MADSQTLREYIKRLKELGQAVRKAEGDLGTLPKRLKAFEAELKKTHQELNRLYKMGFSEGFGISSEEVGDVKARLKAIRSNTEAELTKLERDVANTVGNVNSSFSQMGKQQAVGGDIGTLPKRFRDVETRVQESRQELDRLSKIEGFGISPQSVEEAKDGIEKVRSNTEEELNILEREVDNSVNNINADIARLGEQQIAGVQATTQARRLVTPEEQQSEIDWDAQPTARFRGQPTDFGAVTGLGRLPDQEDFSQQVLESYTQALKNIKNQYGGLDTTLSNVDAELDAATNSWKVQANVLEKVGDKLRLVTKAQSRVTAFGKEAGQKQEVPSFEQYLEAEMGARQVQNLRKELKGYGLDLDEVSSIQKESIGGITTLGWRTKDASGAVQTATVRVDKWGRTLNDMSNRFKSFDQMVANNISKVLRWSIAVGVVYGAMDQMQQSFRDMMTMQEQLIDLSIVTETSMQNMGRWFEEAASIAETTGTTIQGSLEGMRRSLQVAGRVEGVSRGEAATKILEDAATFAQLAGIEVSEASDVMTSALLQMGDSLEGTGDPLLKGQQLLDMWVSVSKEAQVSLLDLGRGFSTASASAASFGVEAEELTAYIATMAEVTGKSSQEAANALRSMFGAIQQPSKQEDLENLGIAVRDFETDELREFPEILNDINDALASGLFDESMIKDLGYILGGQGARRAADMSAFVKSLARANDLAASSTGSHGEAQEALGKKMQSLKTRTVEFKNAIDKLVMALGAEGGLLEAATTIVKTLTSITNTLDSVVTSTKSATLAFAGLTAAWGISKKFALGPRISQAMGTQAPNFGGLLQAQDAGASAGKSMMGAVTTALPAIAVMAGQEFAQKAAGQQDWNETAVQVGGTIVGGVAGGLTGPMGAYIGSYIGNIIGTKITETVEAGEVRKEATGYLGTDIAGLSLEEKQKQLDVINESLSALDFGGKGVFGTLGRLGKVTALRDPEVQENFRRLLQRQETLERSIAAETGEVSPTDTSGLASQQAGYKKLYSSELQAQMQERREELPLEFARGEIGSLREYQSSLERTRTTMTRINPAFTAVVNSSKLLGKSLGDLQGEYTELGNDLADWSDESSKFLTKQANKVNALFEAYKEGEIEKPELREAAREFLNVRDALDRAFQEMQAPDLSVGFTDMTQYTQDQLQQMYNQAQQLQHQYANDMGLTFKEVEKAVDDFVIRSKEGFDEFSSYGEEVIGKQFVDSVKQAMQEAEEATSNFNIRRLQDVSPDKMQEIAERNRYWVEYLSRLKGMGPQEYLDQEGEQFNLVLGKQNTLQQLYSTNEAMLFTLQDIKETEEKQLEGMWNIPSGSTFWVPLTSAFYEGQEGAGGFPELPELIPPTEETARNTGQLTTLGIDQRSRLEQIIEELRNMGLSVEDADQWSAEGALEMFQRSDFWQNLLGDPEERAKQEGHMGLEFPTMEEIISEWRPTREELIGMETPLEKEIPGLDRFGEQVSTAITNGLNNIVPSSDLSSEQESIEEEPESRERYWSPGGYGEEARGNEELSLWQKILETLRAQQSKEIQQGSKKALYSPAPTQMQTKVDVEIPRINGDFRINNTVTLDGRVIARYVSRVVEDALARSIRASGRSRSQTIR
jgi:TP901 family phage tail tape measure protein